MSLLKKPHSLLRYITITAQVCAVIVILLIPFGVYAQTAGPAPRGQVLQATDSCPAVQEAIYGGEGGGSISVRNALDVSVSPTQVASGGSVTITYSIKPECATYGAIGNSYRVNLYHTSVDVNDLSKNQFQRTENQPAIGTINLLVPATQFSPNATHRVVVALNAANTGASTTVANVLVGTVDFAVGAVSQTGAATLTAQQSGTGIAPGVGNQVFYQFQMSFTPGSSGVDPKQVNVTVDCGGGTLDGTNPVSYSQGQVNAKCLFPKKAQAYTVSFQAVKTDGSPVDGAKAVVTVNVTGQEQNTAVETTDATANPVVSFINFVIGSVLKFFIAAMGAAVGIIGSLLESVLSIRTFSDEFANVIYPAWEIFRNLGNIFFILAIVAIGVATVFRISGYQVKDLLVKLILGAILINFSLTIAQAVLGISDTLQQQFLSNQSGAVRAIVNTLFVNNIWYDTPATQLGDFSETIRIVTQFFVAFAAFFAILAIAILVCVRVVMLWLLLMLSPIPYVAMILPSTRKFSSQWWDKFINWALVTPAVGFMLNLTALMTTKNSSVIQDLTAKGQLAVNESWLNNATFALARNVIPLIFLYMTLQVAQSFGKGAGGFVTKSLNKVSGMAFAPAAALGGYAAGVATSTGNFAKNVGKAPLVLAQQKLAEGKAGREARLQAKDGSATASDYVFNALAMPGKLNQILDAKVKRGEGSVKDAQKKYGELITDLEKRKYSWDGTKALGNRVKTKYRGRFGRKDEIYERAEVKTDKELEEFLKKGLTDSKMPAEETKKLIEDAQKSGHTDYGFVKEQLEKAELLLQDSKASEADKKELRERIDALNKVVKDGEIRKKNLAAISDRDDAALENLTEKEILDFREKAQNDLKNFKELEMKSEYAPSYLADKYRRANTKGAAGKLPDEYVYGEVIDFARKAFAKGDMYGALAAVEQIQKEGDTKDMLKEFGYSDTAVDMKRFFKEKFGSGGFGMDEKTVVQLMRESDKYAKSAGLWDLSGKIKYDDKARKYVEEGEDARIAKALDGKIGEGTTEALWRQLTSKVAFTTKEGKTKLSEEYVAAIKRLSADDPVALQKFMRQHNSPTAKNITVKGGKLKTDEEMEEVQGQLRTALGTHYEQVYKLLQYNSGVMPEVKDPNTGEVDVVATKQAEQEIIDEVKKVNAEVKELNKAVNPAKDKKEKDKQNKGNSNGGQGKGNQARPNNQYRGGSGGVTW